MSNPARPLLQRSLASSYLVILKMKGLVPCDVRDELTGYKARIVEVVFDPLRTEEVNSGFEAAGYPIGERMNVIAVNEDESILLLGNTAVFYARKGERLEDALADSHVAFYDILDLTRPFKIKNKKTEIHDLIVKLKEKHGGQ